MIDTHCHLTEPQYEGRVNEIISNFENARIDKVICMGCDPNTNKKAKEIALNNRNVYYAVGIHPEDASTFNLEELESYLINKDEKLVAIGEIGLDYFVSKESKELQKEIFIKQIELAKKYHLPFVIHCREAFGDTLEILKKYAPYPDGAVMHCYSGSLEFAEILVKMGLKVSFTGSVTFTNAKNLHNVAKNLPIDSFFFETDSPYLAPVPLRGTINEPKNVKLVAEFVAGLRGIDVNELIKITDETAKKFFKIN